MSGTTSVPQIAFTTTGFVPPAESAILAGYQADQNAAFGGNVNPALTTGLGQQAVSDTAIIGDSYDQQCLLFNSVDPAYATGRMQDAIARIYFLTRIPAAPTVLQVSCGGGVGVVIPLGATISDVSGNLYNCTGSGVIPSGGSITLPFTAALPGPTPVPSSNGVSIYQAIPTWNTVAVVSGVVGENVETRAAFETRRAASVAMNGAGFYAAIYGNVLAVPGVIDAYVAENYTAGAVVTGGVSLLANSLYVCVAGGTNAAVAFAIWQKKNPGCNYTGNTTVTITDPNPGFGPGPPTYAVTFQIPTAVAISFTVTIANSATVPSNALALVSNAINTAFLGLDGGSRARIGGRILASRFYGQIAMLGSWAQIIEIQLGADTPPDVAFTGSIAATTLTVTAITSATFTGTGSGTNLTASAVTGTIYPGYVISGTGVPVGTTILSQTSGTSGGAGVYVTSASTTSSGASITAVGTIMPGQFVYGANVLAGSLITAQLSGTTGSTGTYTVAVNQTVSSEAMTAVIPNQNSFTMNINQIPTFAAYNPGTGALADVNLVLV